MPSPEESAQVSLQFLLVYGQDRSAGRHLELEHYQRLFPGHEALIAREFAALDWDEGDGLRSRPSGEEE